MAYNPFEYAEALRDQVTAEQAQTIKGFYKSWAEELEEQAKYFDKKTNGSAVVEARYARELKKQIEVGSQEIGKQVAGSAKSSMFKVADGMVASNVKWLSEFGFPKEGLNAAFSHVPTSVVNSLLTGQVYGKTGSWNLSSAIWSASDQTKQQAYSIVAQGVAQQKPIAEIAKALSKYVDPSQKLAWQGPNGMKIYSRSVDYASQRLARTLVQHTYQQTFVATTKDNPFVEKYLWLSNGDRVCPICADRDGVYYEKSKLPLDHPNGQCSMEPVIDPNMVDKLADWVNNPDGTYPEIDEFAKQMGYKPTQMFTGNKQAFSSNMPSMTLKDVQAAYADIEYKNAFIWKNTLSKDEWSVIEFHKKQSGLTWDKFYKKNIYKGGPEAWAEKYGVAKHEAVLDKLYGAMEASELQELAGIVSNMEGNLGYKTFSEFADEVWLGSGGKQVFKNAAKELGVTEDELFVMFKDPQHLKDLKKSIEYSAEHVTLMLEDSISHLPKPLQKFILDNPEAIPSAKWNTPTKWKNGLKSSVASELEAVKKETKWSFKKIHEAFDHDIYDLSEARRDANRAIRRIDKTVAKIELTSSADSELANFVKSLLVDWDNFEGSTYGFWHSLPPEVCKKADDLAKLIYGEGSYSSGSMLIKDFVANAEGAFPPDVYKKIAAEKIAAKEAAEKAAKEAAEKKAKELAAKKAAKEAEKIQAYKDAGVWTKLQKAEKASAKADDDLAKFVSKHGDDKIDDVWKSGPKTVKDYPEVKDSIPSKRAYYEQKLASGNLSAEEVAKYKKLLKNLDDYETAGSEYENLLAASKAAKKEVADIKAPFKKGGFDPEDYDEAVKQAARERVSTRTAADKFHREYLDSIWDDLTDQEKYSIWEYTNGSGGLNRPLSGYAGNWNESNFKGIGNVPWDQESGSMISSSFRKAAGTDTVSYSDAIAGATRAIEHSELPEAVYCVRGSDPSGLSGLIEGDLFSHSEAKALVNGDISKLKEAIEGQDFQWHSFMSTGITEGTGFSGSIQYEIYLPKGTKAIYCEPQSRYGGTASGHIYKAGESYSMVRSEAEILIQRGSTFRVTEVSRESGHIKVKMELIEQPDYFSSGYEHTITNGLTSEKH